MSLLTQDQPRGNVQLQAMLGPTLTPVAVAANTTAEQNFTIPGLLPGDYCDVNGPSITPGLGIVNTRVSAVNTLTLGFANTTSGSLTPPSGTYQVLIWRASYQPVPTSIQ
jgi:hypothetical protein